MQRIERTNHRPHISRRPKGGDKRPALRFEFQRSISRIHRLDLPKLHAQEPGDQLLQVLDLVVTRSKHPSSPPTGCAKSVTTVRDLDLPNAAE